MNPRLLLPLLMFGAGIVCAQNPTFTLAGVANHASLTGGPIAPGELVAIFGSNLGDAVSRSCAGAGGVLPLICSGVSVTANNKDCPVSFIAASQLIFQAPWSLSGSTAAIVVKRVVGGQPLSSATVTVPVAPLSPGVYTGAGNIGLLTPEAGGVHASTPAHPGETVTALGT